MLVLSRRVHERIVLPGLPAAIQVLSVRGRTVRLGIEAPPEVAIVRAEVQDRTRPDGSAAEQAEGTGPGHCHRQVCRRLKLASVGLGVARLQLQAGHTGEVEATLDRLHREIQSLRRQMEPSARQPSRPTVSGRRAPLGHKPSRRRVLAGCPD
jgi:carbon storage regulator CsrA